MKRLLFFLFAGSLFAATPAVTFIKSFPQSDPAYISITVQQTGDLVYKESEDDNSPIKAHLSPAEANQLFDLANQLGRFKSPIESGLKVANMGKKTFRYTDESGAATEAVFNYSTIIPAQQLLQQFEQIAATERAYIDLNRTAKFDKLGVNDALAEIESLWLKKELVAPAQFIPLLERVATHESYMHLARERAARLKDAFTAAGEQPAVASVQ